MVKEAGGDHSVNGVRGNPFFSYNGFRVAVNTLPPHEGMHAHTGNRRRRHGWDFGVVTPS